MNLNVKLTADAFSNQFLNSKEYERTRLHLQYNGCGADNCILIDLIIYLDSGSLLIIIFIRRYEQTRATRDSTSCGHAINKLERIYYTIKKETNFIIISNKNSSNKNRDIFSFLKF
jgi:hypothetical protein